MQLAGSDAMLPLPFPCSLGLATPRSSFFLRGFWESCELVKFTIGTLLCCLGFYTGNRVRRGTALLIPGSARAVRITSAMASCWAVADGHWSETRNATRYRA